MNYPHGRWRLLMTPPSPGAWNMAVDEVLLEQMEHSSAIPCLRLYAWDPPCLSIGYAQKSTDIDIPRLISQGWHWVRRPTGGRAILHTDELTYSITAPLSDPRISGGVLESYQRLSSALLVALNFLDIPAVSSPNSLPNRDKDPGAVCFEVPSNYEIVVQGKKLVGSAQARRKAVMLQHGTFPLTGDLTRITQVLAYPDDQSRSAAAARLLDHAITAESVLGKVVTWQSSASAFIEGFRSALNLDFIPLELSQPEKTRIDQVLQEKYSHPTWQDRI